MQDLKLELNGLIESKTGIVPQSGDTLSSLKIDSLAMAELTVEIETAFNIRVDEEVLDVETIEELERYIRSRALCT